MELLRSLTISDLKPFLADPTQLNTQSIALQLAVASYSQTPRTCFYPTHFEHLQS